MCKNEPTESRGRPPRSAPNMGARREPEAPAGRRQRPLRVLHYTRVARGDGKCAAPTEQQLKDLESWRHRMGYELAGVVAGVPMSGRVHPADRRGLGQWLTSDRRRDWDVLAVTDLARLSRDCVHCEDIAKKFIAWDKRLVALNDPSIDIGIPHGLLLLRLVVAAETRRPKGGSSRG